MRINMKCVRVRLGLSQEKAADRVGCSRSIYRDVENGKRQGKVEFWESFQKTFGIKDSEMWSVMQDVDVKEQ